MRAYPPQRECTTATGSSRCTPLRRADSSVASTTRAVVIDRVGAVADNSAASTASTGRRSAGAALVCAVTGSPAEISRAWTPNGFDGAGH